METEVISEVANQMSMWDLVWASDMVTKVVMIGLIAASVWSWAIIFEKIGTLRQLKARSLKFEEKFWSGGSLDRLYDSIGNHPNDPMAAMFVAAMREWKRTNILKSKTDRGLRGVSLQQRIEKAMAVSMDKDLNSLDTRMGFLASTGSVAPLVGLFGTVWGIMKSFSDVVAAQTASLVVLAPGISASLITTVFGLISALPALMAYYLYSGKVVNLEVDLENFELELMSILSKELEQ